jgi:hypothetical protein
MLRNISLLKRKKIDINDEAMLWNTLPKYDFQFSLSDSQYYKNTSMLQLNKKVKKIAKKKFNVK